MLYLVPTPVGNLQDISYRSIETLKQADLILCEDTRVSKKLFNHYGISSATKSFHSHNEHYKLEEIISLLKDGKNIALVSDAGTPGISDPGFLLVRKCIEEGILTSCLPGATAFVPALIMSGLPANRFYFEGFLPHKKGRQKRLSFLKELDTTIILYESPHRIIRTIRDLVEAFGPDVKAAIVKEISKIHETAWSSDLGKLQESLDSISLKGEFVIVIAPQVHSDDLPAEKSE